MAALEIGIIPCLSDNFCYLVEETESGASMLVDAPEADAISAALDARGVRPDWIWLTHHHPDHVQGVAALAARYGCKVLGNAADAARLPALDRAVAVGERVSLGAEEAEVIGLDGHTIGLVGFHFPGAKAVFVGDALFVMGCGRLFEGAALQAWAGLERLAALPDDTQVFCGHDYAPANLRFALSVEPDNPALADEAARIAAASAGQGPNMPTTIGREKRANPFLRAGAADLQKALGLDGSADAASVFAELRRRKDRF